MSDRLKVSLPGLELKNPIMPASGCFGFGKEYSEFYDLSRLGAIVMKSVTLNERLGNKTPRVSETFGGMLNSIGLQNPGVYKVMERELEFLSKYDTEIIANVAGSTEDEYVETTRIISSHDLVKAIELNISCPNVKQGGIGFGTDFRVASSLVKKVKKVCKKPLYVKLSPNVTNIVEIAKGVEESGADGISMINTLVGMRIDTHKRKPILDNKIGGLSGPCIKPIAIRMIYEVSQQINIPIIGMGGIINQEDVIEFFLAGASAVAIGTANFMNPMICVEIIDKLEQKIKELGVKNISELTGGSYR